MIQPEPSLDANGNELPVADLGHVFAVDPDAAEQDVAGSLVVNAGPERPTHVLTGTAQLVWALLDGQSRMTDILTDVAEAFGVPPTQVQQDFLTVVTEWLRDGLIADLTAASETLTSYRPGTAVRRRRLGNPPND